MSSSLDWLIGEIRNRSVSVTAILRLAQATLEGSKIGRLARRELEGYPRDSVVPRYRWASGCPVCLGPTGRWVDVRLEDMAVQAQLAKCPVYEGVAVLESMLGVGVEALRVPLPGEMVRQILEQNNRNVDAAFRVSREAAKELLEGVRLELLSVMTALQREENELMASKTKSGDEYHFHAPVTGPVGGRDNTNTVNIGQQWPAVVALADDVEDAIGGLDMPAGELVKLRAELGALKVEATKAEPKPSMLQRGLKAVVSILSQAAAREAIGPFIHRAHEILGHLAQSGQ